MRLLAIALLVLSTNAYSQTAAMYRTVSADGTVTFSDVPLTDNSEMITVLVRSGAARSSAPEQSADTQAEDENVAAQTAANCDRAREHEASVSNSTRLYRVLPSGERQFLTDEEITTAREQAAAEVARWCRPAG